VLHRYTNAPESEGDGDLASLAAAMQGKGEAGARSMDTMWSKPARNPLTGVTDADELASLVFKDSRMREPALENMDHEFRNILSEEKWRDSDVDAYLISGMLPAIARWTANYFLELLLKFSLGISIRGWDMVAVAIRFYDTELTNIRAAAKRGFPFLYRTYMFLRDARHEKWTPRKLLDDRTTYTNKGYMELRSLLPTASPLPGTCSYCGSALHRGSHPQCTFKMLETALLAKQAAGRAMMKIATGMTKGVAVA
jgi:hypothetical protein